MLASTKDLLSKAYRNKYAVGAFNVNNLEAIQATISAAEKLKSPVILQTSEGAIKYAGMNVLSSLIKAIAEESKIPIALHLDHGKDMKIIKQAIKQEYSSVMIDASHHDFEKNIKLTRQVVNLAHKKCISVEAELGTIGGSEDFISERRIILTDPMTAKDFVEKTGIDFLAVAIGTSHGAYKFQGKPQLDIKRLKEINKLCRIPLVLHGASEVPKKYIEMIEKYGGKLDSVNGVPCSQVKQAIKFGISKVNTDTDLRLAFDAGMRKFLSENKKDIDPRHSLNEAKKLMQEIIEHRIKIFGTVL